MFEPDSLASLWRRAERAAALGESTFAIPEAAEVAAFAASRCTGSLRAEAERWVDEGAGYHALVRLAARVVLALPSDETPGSAVYVPKARAELEPLLELWPHVLALPTLCAFTPGELVALRAYPVHPLGLVATATWADGRSCSPAEYFFHDLDHARFKIREDLRFEGVELPDAYCNGTTLDPETGQHRSILPAARGKVGSSLWQRATARRAFAERLTAWILTLEPPAAEAAELLLFEILYEKSHALEPAVLERELSSDAHLVKIRRKLTTGFYGQSPPDAPTMARLDEVQSKMRALTSESKEPA